MWEKLDLGEVGKVIDLPAAGAQGAVALSARSGREEAAEHADLRARRRRASSGPRSPARSASSSRRIEEREFEDGEHKARPLTSVRGRDVYLVQSLHGGPAASPERQAVPAAVLRRRAARCRGRARDRGHPLPGLRQEGSADPAARPDHHALRRAADRGGRDRARGGGRRAQPRGLRERLPLPDRSTSRRGRCSSPICCRCSASGRWSSSRRTRAASSAPSCCARRSPGRSGRAWRWPSWRSGAAAACSAARTRWSAASRGARR